MTVAIVCVLCGRPNADPRPWDQREPVCPDCQDREKKATRRGAIALILGAIAAVKLKPSPAWAPIMPPQEVLTVEVEELIRTRTDYYVIDWPWDLQRYDWRVDSEKVLARHFPRSPDEDPPLAG